MNRQELKQVLSKELQKTGIDRVDADVLAISIINSFTTPDMKEVDNAISSVNLLSISNCIRKTISIIIDSQRYLITKKIIATHEVIDLMYNGQEDDPGPIYEGSSKQCKYFISNQNDTHDSYRIFPKFKS